MKNTAFDSDQTLSSKFYYGYIVVGLCFLIMMVSFGLYDSFGVFVKPIINTFGWSRATTTAAYSLSFLVFGLVGILMGGATDRFGLQVVLTLCGICLGLGYILMSQLQLLWNLYLFYGFFIGVGMSAIYAPVLSQIPKWFNRRCGLMTGLVLSGTGIGQLLAPPIISRLVAHYDWRLTYIILGISIFVIVVISTQFLRNNTAQSQPQPEDAPTGACSESTDAISTSATGTKGYSFRDASRTMQFWVLIGYKFCLGYSMLTIIVHIVPHATDFGIPAINAANLIASHGAAMVIGSFVLGRVGDLIGPRQVMIICFSLSLASLLWLLKAREMWALYLFCVVFGFANAGNVASDVPLLARLFGFESIGSITGVSSCAFAVGVAFGPSFTGYVFDVTGSYQTAFLICVIFSALGIVFTALQRPTPRLQIKI